MDRTKEILEELRALREATVAREPAFLIDADQVLGRLGLSSRTTLYAYIDRYGFPKGRQVGGSTRWIASEVDAWIRARPQATQSIRETDANASRP